ncbi:MAG: acyltransferase family protein [Pseudomonadota bacterium]
MRHLPPPPQTRYPPSMSHPQVNLGYRPDIDGLRAVAILPVVFYHSGLGLFPGGYVGVDVFFVISGFLITGIIAREVDEGRFSILNFYERRARRIMPALMVMLAFVLCAAAYSFFPGDFAKLPKSALMTTLFVSNIGFFLETGYFAGSAETVPLLHTWSLAVEEQFYLGFPILLILIARFVPGRRMTTLVAIALISFALAVATQASGSGFAFYLLPPRAWELFIGALIAVGGVPAIRSHWLREGVALAGLAAIAYAALCFDKTTVFPGVNALFPVLGAAALILCAPRTVVGRLLETGPMVGIGLISYSLYLWHWPLIVFTEYMTDTRPAGWVSVMVISASFIAAFFSWRFVERPFRSTAAFDRRAVFRWTGVSMTLACAASLTLMTTNGWPARFSPETRRMDAARNDVSPARVECIADEIGGLRPECTLGARVPPTTILWGDSHGVELAWAISEVLAQRKASLMQRTRGSCPPMLGYGTEGCIAFNAQMLGMIAANSDLRTVILVGFWVDPAYGAGENPQKLDQTIRALRRLNRKVILIGAVPQQPFDVPRHLARLTQRGDPTEGVGVTRVEFDERSAWLRRYYPGWRALGVTIWEPSDTLCNAQYCAVIRDGVPIHFDKHHLSLSGARRVVRPHRITN